MDSDFNTLLKAAVGNQLLHATQSQAVADDLISVLTGALAAAVVARYGYKDPEQIDAACMALEMTLRNTALNCARDIGRHNGRPT